MGYFKVKYLEDSSIPAAKLAETYIQTSEKGAASGVATLDGTGRIPSAQLPTTAAQYLGAWNATTNSPTLTNGTGTNGDFYRVSVAGSVDFGAGSISFGVGDMVIYNGSVWERIPADDAVTSVNGQTGIVSLDSDDISEGATNLYYTETRFDSSFSGKSTTDLSEGTNLYFTDARARTAAVDDTAYGVSWDGVTNIAPSKNAVYDAIEALPAPLTNGFESFTLNGTDISNGYVELSQIANANSVHLVVDGGPGMIQGVDYTLSTPVTNTRITFAGDLATELASGDVISVYYEY